MKKVEISTEYAQKLYAFLNEVNVPFEEKEALILELRSAYQKAHEDKQINK